MVGKISNESPVGQALIGKKVGDTVSVETQAEKSSTKCLRSAVQCKQMIINRPLFKRSRFAAHWECFKIGEKADKEKKA